jgi:hypothetical protein
MLECKDNSFYNRLGRWRVVKLVWGAIPWQFRLLGFPYCLFVYRRLLAQSTRVSEVRTMHSSLYSNSGIYRTLRPRFRVIKQALLPLES